MTNERAFAGRPVILGGSFNPVHHGHLFLAEQALVSAGFDSVILVPSSKPAHKSDKEMAFAQDRLEMVRLSISGWTQWRVDDCEIRRGGISYSLDTVRELRDRYQWKEKPGLLIGDDLLEGFDRWNRVEELVREVDLVIAVRGVSDIPATFRWPHRVLRNRPYPVSSTEIRERIRSREAWKTLVPRDAADYIEEKRLYRD